jgi:hypothetical protein
LILVDSHVHIYDCFDLEKFFDSAYANFKSAAEQFDHGNNFTGILLLTETSKDNWFQRLAEYADGKDLPEGKSTGSWIFRRTKESNSLIAESVGLKNLILIAGRQIVTGEEIEVLACATIEKFRDSSPIKSLIKEIKQKDGLPIIPWGVGKWYGNRGEIIKGIINKFSNNSSIYLGDNGNRPSLWPQPRLFQEARKRGIHVLPGSDPLPFASECSRVGCYGFSMQVQIDRRKAASLLKQILMNKINDNFHVFGRLEKNHRFLLNQIRAQLRKRFTGTNLN